MATLYSPDANNKLLHTGDHGNAVIYTYEYDAAASSADVLRLGKIPAGTRVTSVRLIGEDTGTSVTLDVGYAPADGTAPTAAPSYWWNDLDTSTAAVDVTSGSLPIRFERDVWLEALVNSANFTGTPKLTFIVTGINEGVK